jgi:hypothetical protein
MVAGNTGRLGYAGYGSIRRVCNACVFTEAFCGAGCAQKNRRDASDFRYEPSNFCYEPSNFCYDPPDFVCHTSKFV